jgi:type IV secretion system protein VirD4
MLKIIKNISVSKQQRALMLPQEIQQMGNDTCIILMENCKPIKAGKIKYYKDKKYIEKCAMGKVGVDKILRTINQKENLQQAIQNNKNKLSTAAISLMAKYNKS